MAGVRLVNLTKRYGKNEVVKSVNLTVEDGEFIVLVGPSGCGKTTTLRMVAGLEEITDGQIWIGNRVVNDLPPKNRDVAMVFQNYALYPHMSVYDNLAFGLRVRKVASGEVDKRVKEVAAMLGISEYLHRKPKHLSGGQRQRVALGRAIVREPQVFLMDEPLSNLDAKLRVQTRFELLRLHQRLRVTTIYVTHDQVEAMTMGQRIAVMRDGVVQQYDRPQVVYEQPANLFVAGFIGSPGMNFVNVVVRTTDKKVELLNQDGLNVALPENTGNRLASNGEQVIMGVRPEHMKLVSVEDTHRCFVGCIAAVEALGFEKLVHVTLGSSTVVVRVPGSTSVRIGENVGVYFPGDAIHIFNKSDGRSLSYGAKSDSPRAVLV